MKSIVLTTKTGDYTTYVGRKGEIVLNESSGELRYHDGLTPGGRPVVTLSKTDVMSVVEDSFVMKEAVGTPQGVASLSEAGKIMHEQMPDIDAMVERFFTNGILDGGQF